MIEAIQFTLAVTYILMGLSLMIRSQEWLGWTQRFRDGGRQNAVLGGMIGVMVGSFIVGAHPVWTGAPLLVTAFGVLSIAEGASYMLFPALMNTVLTLFLRGGEGLFRFLGLFTFLIGLAIAMIWLA